jgi:hypothetical protein
MTQPDKRAFLDAKNTLLLVRQLARLDHERLSNERLHAILTEEEKKNGYSRQVPLLNQAAFLALAYSAFVWLRESYFKDDSAKEKIANHVAWIFDDPSLKIVTGPKSQSIDKANPQRLVRRVRNSLGHASVEIDDDAFVFTDTDPRCDKNWVTIRMSWAALGKLSESIIFAGNDLLYSELSDTA